MFPEEGEGPLPSPLGRLGVVDVRPVIVEEGVIRTRVPDEFSIDPCRTQLLLERVDLLLRVGVVLLGEMTEDGSTDPGDIGFGRVRGAEVRVERDDRGEQVADFRGGQLAGVTRLEVAELDGADVGADQPGDRMAIDIRTSAGLPTGV